MSSEEPEKVEAEGETRLTRPVVLPTVVVPIRVLYLTAAALVGAVGLAMVAGLIRAIAFSEPTAQGISGADVSQPSLTFADRLSIFTSEGAGITIAILVALAVALAAIAGRTEDRPERVRMMILVVSSVAAAVIVALNAIMFVEVLANTQGIFLANETANKASSAISHLEPILLGVGAILYSASRLRIDWDENATEKPLDEAGPG
jgi:hypothetical protein